MGENAKKIGEKLEGWGQGLYERFKWGELVRDKEFKCTKSTHRTDKDNPKKTHGIDLYHKCFDPYKNQTLSVITECKNYQWASINEKSIQEWIEQLEWTIECAQNAEELIDFNSKCDVHYNGILLIHANDGLYEGGKFREYLRGQRYKSKRNPLNIFVAGNEEIEQWYSMYNLIDTKFNDKDSTFNFHYPSIMGSGLYKSPQIALIHLFSKFVFAEYAEKVITEGEKKTTIETKIKKIIFSFDDIAENAFQYLCSMFQELQLADADEYVFCFYPKSTADVELIDSRFKKYAKEAKLDIDKLNIEFMRNNKLSPVNNSVV